MPQGTSNESHCLADSNESHCLADSRGGGGTKKPLHIAGEVIAYRKAKKTKKNEMGTVNNTASGRKLSNPFADK